MRPVIAIARNTVREALRERIALVAVVFGLAMVLASQVLAPLALGEGKKIVTDFGLAGSSLLATLLAVTLGTSLLHKELERRT
ncbi:MAG TPA: ABC transporter permease, partial [Candidatus Eisenbacteria bacterium]|nr:ABC transporter permease [Candidatus Eisenbacteria bacterium]